MLTERDFKLIEKESSKIYGDLEFEIIKEIAKRIANVGYANTVVHNDVVILEEIRGITRRHYKSSCEV